MWGKEQDKWFEQMQQEQLTPSCKTVVTARKKAQEAKEKREFLEEYLPIIIICGLNACFAIGVGIAFKCLIVGFGQRSMGISIVLAIGYLPLLAYSIATLCIKNSQTKKEELKCQDQ